MDGSSTGWDMQNYQEIVTFEGHSKEVAAVAMTPDGRFGVSGDNEGGLKVRDLEAQSESLTLKSSLSNPSSTSESPEGGVLVETVKVGYRCGT